MGFSFGSAIAFGLVFIPCKLHAAVRTSDISFNMLEKNSLSRIKYKKTCVDCDGRELSSADIVKGYQYQTGRYVVVTDDELEKLKTRRDKTINIERFVALSDIDPIFFDRAYYVEPTGAPRAFQLLLSAMKSQNKAAIARSVLGNKEVLLAVRAKDEHLLVSTMFFADEVVSPSFKIVPHQVSESELELANNIIMAMSGDFVPSDYRNEYKERLLAALNAKIAGEEILPAQEPAQTTVASLMDALQKSLESLDKTTPDVYNKTVKTANKLNHPTPKSPKSKETPINHPAQKSPKSKETQSNHPAQKSPKSKESPINHPAPKAAKSKETQSNQPSKKQSTKREPAKKAPTKSEPISHKRIAAKSGSKNSITEKQKKAPRKDS